MGEELYRDWYNLTEMRTYILFIHWSLSWGRVCSRSYCKDIRSEQRLDICWTMPGADTYVDGPAWISEKLISINNNPEMVK